MIFEANKNAHGWGRVLHVDIYFIHWGIQGIPWTKSIEIPLMASNNHHAKAIGSAYCMYT